MIYEQYRKESNKNIVFSIMSSFINHILFSLSNSVNPIVEKCNIVKNRRKNYMSSFSSLINGTSINLYNGI